MSVLKELLKAFPAVIVAVIALCTLLPVLLFLDGFLRVVLTAAFIAAWFLVYYAYDLPDLLWKNLADVSPYRFKYPGEVVNLRGPALRAFQEKLPQEAQHLLGLQEGRIDELAKGIKELEKQLEKKLDINIQKTLTQVEEQMREDFIKNSKAIFQDPAGNKVRMLSKTSDKTIGWLLELLQDSRGQVAARYIDKERKTKMTKPVRQELFGDWINTINEGYVMVYFDEFGRHSPPHFIGELI
jgi:hypothetical protein